MAPPNRTTLEQLEWLNSLKPRFSEHQKEKTLSDFWSNLDRDWFARWPEPGVAEAEHSPEGHPSRKKATEALSCRKSYLRNWFNNRSANKRKVPIKAQPQITISRSHQPVEIYSKQFYKEKIKPLVTSELAENEIPKNEKLAVVKNFTKAAFDAEPEDVREAIFAQAKALKAENAARRADTKKSEGHTSPEGYATAIESVAYVLNSFVRDLAMRTGWAFSVLGGGPDPVNGGRIQTISFHEGRNVLGASFKKAHVSFDESVLKPYIEFLNQIYPPAVCQARALSDSVNESVNSPPSGATSENAVNNGSYMVPSPVSSAPEVPAANDALEVPAASDAPDTSAASDAPETPAVGNIPGTYQPDTGANESNTVHGPSTIPQVANTTQNMSNIDPQLLPPSPAASAELPTHTLPTPAVNTPLFNFPPTCSFAPQAAIGSAVSDLAAPQVSGGPPIPPAPSLALTTSTTPPHTPLLDIPPATDEAAPAKKTPSRPKPRKRPGVQPISALQKVTERAIAEKTVAVEKEMEGKENTWSNELTKAVKAAEARAAKAAAAKATKVAKAAGAKAAKAAKAAEAAAAAEAVSAPTPDMSNVPAVLQLGRSQRVRKAATSKEVVSLTDKRKRQDSKENDAGPKKARIR